MRTNLALTAGLLFLALAGCGSEPAGQADQTAPAQPSEAPATTQQPADPVDTAAAVARELEANPEDAAAILERHGLTAEKLDELMYEIAADPVKAERYRKAVQP